MKGLRDILSDALLCIGVMLIVNGGAVSWPVLPVMPWTVIDTAPIKEPGFRVLLTYDESNRSTLTPGQKQIYDSTAIPAYLDAHCVKDSTGTPGWRLWPDATAPKADQPIWQQAIALVKGKGQMVVISDGKRGTIQPWPADEAAMLALLKKYGGA